MNTQNSPEQTQGRMLIVKVATKQFDSDVARDVERALPELLKFTKNDYVKLAEVVATSDPKARNPVGYIRMTAENLGLTGPVAGRKTVISKKAKILVNQMRGAASPIVYAPRLIDMWGAANKPIFKSELFDLLNCLRGQAALSDLPNTEIVSEARKITEKNNVGAPDQIALRRKWFTEFAAEWLGRDPKPITVALPSESRPSARSETHPAA